MLSETSSSSQSTDRLAAFFRALSQPSRIDILLAIGGGEACVCHLEAALGLRQAYISQQLMALRDAGLLETRREGRFVYYRLSGERLLPLLQSAAAAAGIDGEAITPASSAWVHANCACPKCAPEAQVLISPEVIEANLSD